VVRDPRVTTEPLVDFRALRRPWTGGLGSLSGWRRFEHLF